MGIDLITAEYFKFKSAEGGKGLKQCGLSIGPTFFRGGGVKWGIKGVKWNLNYFDRFNHS